MNFILENANLTMKTNADLTDDADSFRDFGEEGLIIGIVFSVVAVVVICFYILRWKRKQLAQNQPSTCVELDLNGDNEIILLVRSYHYHKNILKCLLHIVASLKDSYRNRRNTPH